MSEKRTKQYENAAKLEIIKARKSKSMDLGKYCYAALTEYMHGVKSVFSLHCHSVLLRWDCLHNSIYIYTYISQGPKVKCVGMTFIMIWRCTNKDELSWIELKKQYVLFLWAYVP